MPDRANAKKFEHAARSLILVLQHLEAIDRIDGANPLLMWAKVQMIDT